jgi:antitoxin HicB
MSREYLGSSIDDFLIEEGIFEEAQALAIEELAAWRLAEASKRQASSVNDDARPS